MTKTKVATFQERFAELLEESKFSLSYVAESIGVSYKTVYSWQKGNREPKLPSIVTVANWFGVAPEWLRGYDVDKYTGTALPARTVEARIVSAAMDQLPQEDREKLVAMVRAMYANRPEIFSNKKGDNEDEG